MPMKKKMLYIAPDHYDFYKVILKGFQDFTDHSVVMVLSNGYSYHYKNLGERCLNFFLKLCFHTNIKKIHSQKVILQKINQYPTYDIVYVNRPDMLSTELLALIAQKATFSIAHYWDSFSKIKGQKETMPYFDIHYSFDQNDCTQYGLHFTPNFYFTENHSSKPQYDVLFLGTYDYRFTQIKQIIQQLNHQGKNAKALLFSKDKNIRKKHTSQKISFLDKIIPFSEIVAHSGNTQIILDIHHRNQSGLSFRPFEAMGLKKKLITTNPHIKTYDFYNPNNIFIWTNTTLSVPDSFFTTPYTEIPIAIRQKYTLENWVHSITIIKIFHYDATKNLFYLPRHQSAHRRHQTTLPTG